MSDYFIKRPMLLCGIGCIILSAISFYAEIFLFFIICVIPVITLFLILRKSDIRLIIVAILIFVMSLSCNAQLKKINKLSAFANLTTQGYFTVCKIDYQNEKYNIATLEVMSGSYLPKGTYIKAYYSQPKIAVGQKMKACVKIEPVSDDQYKADNYSKEIFIKGNLKDIEIIENQEDFVLATAENIKTYIKNTLKTYIGNNECATLYALLFGDRSYFSDQFYKNVKLAGVSHVMVVSGMHMAILVSFFVKISEKIFYNRYIKAVLMVFIVALLTVLCGFTMSVLRAGITYVFMAIGILFDRKGLPENTLGSALTAILISSPFAIFSISLQLSLLSTFGILVIAIPLIDLLETKEKLNKITRPIVTSILFSLSALIMVLPVTIYVFGFISVVSVITNLLVSNIVTIVISLAVAGLIINLLSPFAAIPVFFITELITKYINSVIIILGSMPFAAVTAPKSLSYFAIILIFILLSFLLACKKRNNMLKLNEVNKKIIKEGGKETKWRQ